MSRYDHLSTDEIKDGVVALGQLAQQYDADHWQKGQDLVHGEINQVLTEIQNRKGN